MVKSGADRALKYNLKHDAYCNMLRAKKLDKLAIKLFNKAVYQNVMIDKYVSQLNVLYGQKGEMADLLKTYFFKGTDILADLQRFGYDSSIFDEFETFKTKYFRSFQFCKYPKSSLRISVTVTPQPIKTLTNVTIDYEQNGYIISENEVLEQENGIAFCNVCVNNSSKILAPVLKTPSIAVDLFVTLGALSNPLVSVHQALKLSPVIDECSNNNNVNNLEPSISISVVKTP